MASFKEALSKVFLNLFLLSVHVALNFVTAINCFYSPLKQKVMSSLITFFSLFCGIYISGVEKPLDAIDKALFLLLSFLIPSVTDWLFCTDQNDLTPEK